MFKINHILQRPEKIIPWGDKEKSLSWFGLTDGLLSQSRIISITTLKLLMPEWKGGNHYIMI